MKKAMQKFGLLLCAAVLILAFALSGCTGVGTEGDNSRIESDIPEGVEFSPNGKEVFKETKEGKTRIKISYNLSGYGSDWIKLMAAHFVNENPEYWLFLDGDSGLTDSVNTKLETELNLSDVYFLLASNSNIYAQQGWLADLSDVYESKPDGEDGKTVFDKLKPKWKDHAYAKYKGEYAQYVYPWTESITGIAYNKSMFDRYGWKVPETMEELLTLCDKIISDTNKSVYPFVYPGQVGGYYGYLVAQWWLHSTGYDAVEDFYQFESAEVFNPDTQPGKGKLEALEAFVSLFGPNANYSIPGSMSKNHIEAQLAFLRGEAAMIPSASWLESEMIEDIPEGFDLRLMHAPYLDTAQKNEDGSYKRYSYACSPDYAIIPAKAPELAGAKKFLSFMSRDDMLKLFTRYAGTLRPFEYDVDDVYDQCSEFTKSCIDITKNAQMFFESTKAPLYTAGHVMTFLDTTNPFPALTYGPGNGGTTPRKMCEDEYFKARTSWAEWEASV